MISLSLRPTGHPPSFQPRSVRPSTRSYPRFSLPMGSSLSFGYTAYDSIALFRLAFAPAPSFSDLTSPRASNSSAHSSKGTPSGYWLSHQQHPLTACRHEVSGTISLPFRGAFHLSLTVLVHYRSPRVLSLRAWSPQVPAEFHVLRGTQVPARSQHAFDYWAITISGRPFQAARLAC